MLTLFAVLHLFLSRFHVPCGLVKASEFAAFIFRSTLGFSPKVSPQIALEELFENSYYFC